MTSLYTPRASLAAGEELAAVVTCSVASAADYPELEADGLTVLRRDGHLVTAAAKRPVAAVTSVYVPGRLPAQAARLLARTEIPLGLALEPYGAWREELETGKGRTRGLLRLADGTPAALAWERAL